uniref:MBL fold metallo-hydrolase n=1 Tax=Roseburia inulinivorans TaxID=360807 RepID=UPI004038F282
MNKSKKYILSFVCILFGLLLFFNCIHAARQAQPLSDTLGQSYDLRSDYLITQYADATGQHGTFYTIENSKSLIILDGGWSGNADAVRSVIAAHDNTVNAWIISHPHQDHAGGVNSIYSVHHGITIEQLYDKT